MKSKQLSAFAITMLTALPLACSVDVAYGESASSTDNPSVEIVELNGNLKAAIVVSSLQSAPAVEPTADQAQADNAATQAPKNTTILVSADDSDTQDASSDSSSSAPSDISSTSPDSSTTTATDSSSTTPADSSSATSASDGSSSGSSE